MALRRLTVRCTGCGHTSECVARMPRRGGFVCGKCGEPGTVIASAPAGVEASEARCYDCKTVVEATRSRVLDGHVYCMECANKAPVDVRTKAAKGWNDHKGPTSRKRH